MLAIETNGLTKKFGKLTAVDNVNLKVNQGEIFGLLGPNGAGKSTFISMLCTILNPTSGTARVEGYDIVKRASDVRRSIGIVFQDPSIDDKLTGMENMELHADLYNVPKDVMHSRIDEVLQLVELEDRASNLVNTYSGGMRRRLEIARSLIHYPKVLFLDEPEDVWSSNSSYYPGNYSDSSWNNYWSTLNNHCSRASNTINDNNHNWFNMYWSDHCKSYEQFGKLWYYSNIC